MKPSTRIAELTQELKDTFDKEKPFFLLDNWYYPDFKQRAIIQYLDEEYEKNN